MISVNGHQWEQWEHGISVNRGHYEQVAIELDEDDPEKVLLWDRSTVQELIDQANAQPTQPDAVEALTYTIVEWGDLGPMCFTSQDANRVTLAEAKEALERILSNNPYNRRFTICAVHPVPSALTTDEEGA